MNALIPAGLPARRAEDRADREFGSGLLPRILVVQRDPHGLRPAVQRAIVRRDVALDEGRLPGYPPGSIAAPYLNTLRAAPAARERGTTAITYIAFPSNLEVNHQRNLAARFAESLSRVGPTAYLTGFIPGNLEQSRSIADHLAAVTLATLGVVALIIGLSMRSLLAPLVTLAAAGVAWLLATRAVAYLAERTGVTLDKEVEPVVAVLLLGVVTDYAVFFLAGARSRLLAGARPVEAARTTTATVAPIVFVAAWLVALGLTTLRIGSIGFVQSLGPAMAVVVLVAMAVAVSFVPAAVALLGRALYWPGLHEPERALGRWLRLWSARLLGRRWIALPVIALVAAALVAAASRLPAMRLALTPITALPADSVAARGDREAALGFAAGVVAPTEVVVRRRGIGRDGAALARLSRAIAGVPGVAASIGAAELPVPRLRRLFRSPTGDAARWLVVLRDHPYDTGAIDDLRRLERAMPRLLAEAALPGAQVAYAGDTAIASDTVDRLRHDVVRVAVAAFLVNLLLLALFLRALVAPLLLLAGSALALAATFGVTTSFFEGALGYSDLTYYVPLAVGVLLLSFGSDYNLFVVGRIWQESGRGASVAAAIEEAVPRASRAISVAGVALALSFACLALVPLRPFREFAFATAAGILIDTFLVRTYLVPALLVLFGRVSWWPGRRTRRRPGGTQVRRG